MSFKIIFIGAGSIAQAHLEAFRLAGASVEGVCTRTDSGQQFAQIHGISHYAQTPTELIEITQPDAVVLLTQPTSYREILQAIGPYNLPVLIEKPLGLTVADAALLRPYLPSKTFVGLNRRFYGNIQAVKPLLDELEGPMMVQVTMPEREKDYAQYADPVIRNHWDMLQGIHLVDLAVYLAGPLKTSLAQTQWGNLPYTETSCYTMALYETTQNHRVIFMSNFDSPGGWRIHCFLPKAEVMISPLEKTVIKTMTGIQELAMTDADQQAKPGFLAQARCFLKGVAASPDTALPHDWVTFDDAFQSMQTLEHLFPIRQTCLRQGV
jgi:predicted dehydrogenase